MLSKSMKKCVQISRIIITLMVFIILNIWFIIENDPQWLVSIIISTIVFFISYPSSKICKFLINKGDKIERKILKVLYYAFILPIIFFLLICTVALLCALVVEFFVPENLLNLGTAVLIAFTGIGIFTCVLVPYFQTLIILIIRYLLNLGNRAKE